MAEKLLALIILDFWNINIVLKARRT